MNDPPSLPAPSRAEILRRIRENVGAFDQSGTDRARVSAIEADLTLLDLLHAMELESSSNASDSTWRYVVAGQVAGQFVVRLLELAAGIRSYIQPPYRRGEIDADIRLRDKAFETRCGAIAGEFGHARGYYVHLLVAC